MPLPIHSHETTTPDVISQVNRQHDDNFLSPQTPQKTRHNGAREKSRTDEARSVTEGDAKDPRESRQDAQGGLLALLPVRPFFFCHALQ